MNTKLLLILVSMAAFGGCTTIYKSGQTPDDVYFSPNRPVGNDDEVRTEKRSDPSYGYNNEDRVIRLGINDTRYRYLDYDYNYSNSLYINDYSYSPYSYGYNYGYYYNPYYYPFPVFNSYYVVPSAPKNTTPRMTNLSGYGPVKSARLSSMPSHGGVYKPVRSYNNTNNRSAVGNAIRQIFAPSNNNNSSSSSANNNTRSYTPSTSNNSSGSRSAGSSSGGSISRPTRH